MRKSTWAGGLAGLLAIVLASCATAPDTAQPSGPDQQPQPALPFAPGFLRETRIVYPLEISGWRAIDEHIYDDQALGAMVRYTNGDKKTRLDVFYYPAGPLLERQVRAAAAEQRQGIALARTQAGDEAPDLGPLRDFAVPMPAQPGLPPTDDEKLTGHSMEAILVSGGEKYNSAMVQFHRSLYFIKGRMSQPAPGQGPQELREQLEEFMAALVDRVRIVNTGTCARELPVEPWTADSPPADAMVSVENGDSSAWVLADRVVATDPSSEQAFLARTVGMAVQGRLPPDCMGPDPVEPVVEEGMREIRIEYRGQ